MKCRSEERWKPKGENTFSLFPRETPSRYRSLVPVPLSELEGGVETDRSTFRTGIVAPPKPYIPRETSKPLPPVQEPQLLSPLQRLAASRKAEQARTKAQQRQTTEESCSTATPPKVNAPAKPLSKLAQLAAQRKAASAASSSPQVVTATSSSNSSVPAKTTGSRTATEQEAPGGKPVSKLAQRIAAAKAAKAQAEADDTKTSATQISETTQSLDSQPPVARPHAMDVDVNEKASPLFTFPSQLERELPGQHKNTQTSVFFSSSTGTGPSEFFTLLTTTPKTSRVLPGDPQKEALAKRRRRSEPGRDPFEELDPDEAVMKAREGTRLAPGTVKRK